MIKGVRVVLTIVILQMLMSPPAMALAGDMAKEIKKFYDCYSYKALNSRLFCVRDRLAEEMNMSQVSSNMIYLGQIENLEMPRLCRRSEINSVTVAKPKFQYVCFSWKHNKQKMQGMLAYRRHKKLKGAKIRFVYHLESGSD